MKYVDPLGLCKEQTLPNMGERAAGDNIGSMLRGEGKGEPSSNFANRELLEGHYEKHGGEFKDSYKNADEYLQGANDVMNGGTKVQYEYKLKNGTVDTRNGYVKFMGNTRKAKLNLNLLVQIIMEI